MPCVLYCALRYKKKTYKGNMKRKNKQTYPRRKQSVPGLGGQFALPPRGDVPTGRAPTPTSLPWFQQHDLRGGAIHVEEEEVTTMLEIDEEHDDERRGSYHKMNWN